MQRTSTGSATTPDELLEVLLGTPLRLRILETLTGDALDRRDLADRTNAARTTLRHNLDRLLEAGLLAETLANEYRVTARGRIAMGAVETYRDRVETGLRVEPFLRRFPLSDRSLELTWFDDADLTVAERGQPRAAGQRVLTAAESASSLDGLLPCLPGRADGRLQPILTGTEREVRLIVDTSLLEAIRAVLAGIGENESELEVTVARDAPSFGGLILEDTTTLLFVLDDGGRPHATLETTDDRCRRWFTRLIETLETESMEAGVATS